MTFTDRMNSKDLDMMTSTWTSLNGGGGSLVNIVEDQKGSELSGSFDVRVGGSGSWGTIAHDATAADVKNVKNVLELHGCSEPSEPGHMSRGSTDRDHFHGCLQQWALRSCLRWNDHGCAGLGH